jgi:hypothetical protein
MNRYHVLPVERRDVELTRFGIWETRSGLDSLTRSSRHTRVYANPPCILGNFPLRRRYTVEYHWAACRWHRALGRGESPAEHDGHDKLASSLGLPVRDAEQLGPACL